MMVLASANDHRYPGYDFRTGYDAKRLGKDYRGLGRLLNETREALGADATISMSLCVRRADRPQPGRGDAAAATRIFRGDEPRRRDVGIPRRRVAAATRIFR